MKITSLHATFFIWAITAQSTRKTEVIYLEPIDFSNYYQPTKLATISYDPFILDTEFSSYETPILSELFPDDHPEPNIKYFRVGIYDVTTASWTSSTTLTSVETFAKGYSPTFTVNFNQEGTIDSVSVKAYRIDAGATRNFGPKIKVMRMINGPKPYLNKPVILKEGKVEVPVPEKSFLQKYWWLIAAALMLIVSTKGDTD
ncbi:hypothetical protein OnM2_049041 [Erysiphe neolycopersici]|uniref:Uncharacterized protein n=1 Tax=Erysiphe neolycopersici TaxID=212602 RepID=A0A420HT01_9PEZI|nr:hypothetical protein OnM2_049041 [Erysiphe neolycopersici]